MNSLKIPENHSGISKTLRLPEDIVEEIQNLANLKNLSFNKTIISKLKAYSKVLKSLNSDQYMLLTSKLNSLVSESKVKYVIPEWTCPECGTEIPERPIPSMLAMVFDRRQLAPIMNS